MARKNRISIAITAMGGQGGGVLAGWIAALAEQNGWLAQSTSVPGVAQRTGATIYYVELFSKAAAKKAGATPVLALMPAPGDVDIVIASEIMEAGRALLRGLIGPDTALIASTHRIYAISEKEGLGDGRKDAAMVRQRVETAAGQCVTFDMDAAAAETGCIISAVLFGALAGAGVLPFACADFEAVIKAGGKAVPTNLRGFALGFERAQGVEKPVLAEPDQSAGASSVPAPAVAALAQRLHDFAPKTRAMVRQGLQRTIDYQDLRHGALYLDRLGSLHALDAAQNGARRGFRLTRDVARYLALAMSREDTIRVADLKTRGERFARVREDIVAAPGQIVRLAEFMHPRLQEFCDLLPAPLGRFILGSSLTRKLLSPLFKKGRRIETTSLHGFLFLRFIAALKPLRRISLGHQREEARLMHWLAIISQTAPQNYALACEIAGLQRLVKGYGDTYERGLWRYGAIMDSLGSIAQKPDAAKRLHALKVAALADEEGAALARELAKTAPEAA